MAVTGISRRGLLLTSAAGAAASFAPSAFAQQGDPLAGPALFDDVRRYAAFGDHRTGGEPDLKTSQWLADELKRAGFKAKLSPWTHQQFFIRSHRLAVNDVEIESFPLWWPRSTGPQPIMAPLAAMDGGDVAGKIAFASVGPVAGASVLPGDAVGQLVTAAARRRARALVLAIRSPAGEVVALNAMSGLSQWPIPVLCAGGKDEARLAEGAAAGAAASVLLDGQLDFAAKGYETIGALDRGPQRVVVSTPSSGWFQCAGERGPGIALWLGLARWAARQKGQTSYTFVASSGHELESMGMRHFAGEAPPVATTRSWLHLGAGIATYDYEFGPSGAKRLDRASSARRLMTNEASYVPVLERQFKDLPGLRPTLTPDPAGEMILMARQGYKVWGFAGGSAFHHMPGDTPERITGPELLEPVARAIVGSLTEIIAG